MDILFFDFGKVIFSGSGLSVLRISFCLVELLKGFSVGNGLRFFSGVLKDSVGFFRFRFNVLLVCVGCVRLLLSFYCFGSD